jgi:hypothetical protein
MAQDERVLAAIADAIRATAALHPINAETAPANQISPGATEVGGSGITVVAGPVSGRQLGRALLRAKLFPGSQETALEALKVRITLAEALVFNGGVV